jgi:hypothetical protein
MTPLTARRRGAWALVVLGVLGGHAWLGWQLAHSLAQLGVGTAPTPPRIEVAFVRELAPAAPPVVVAAAPPPARPRRAAPVAPLPPPEPASVASSAAQVAPELPASAPAPETPASAVADAAPAATAPASAVATAPPFEWPVSTQLNYVLTGNYQGEVHGGAQVQWLRDGTRYQVHLDVHVGPSFAPIMSRRMSSDGELGDAGLTPQRYDEETRAFFRTRRARLRFEADAIVLANGKTRPAWPGVQDSASQFVQLTWLFSTQPQRLQVGAQVALPLALPRRVDLWTYEVLAQETLHTPIGELATFHLKPRRESPRQGELVAEMWIAPSLAYLPVRIRIQQDAETFIDLMVESRPLQGEAVPRAPTPASAPYSE